MFRKAEHVLQEQMPKGFDGPTSLRMESSFPLVARLITCTPDCVSRLFAYGIAIAGSKSNQKRCCEERYCLNNEPLIV
jgi:hypothetical protein